MGIEDRDYIRNSSSSYSGGGSEAPVCRGLIIATVVVFVMQLVLAQDPSQASIEHVQQQYRQHFPMMTDEQIGEMTSNLPRESVIQNWLELETPKVLYGQIWRLVTCAFCHDRDDVWHILLNMVFLWMWGKTLEGMYGSKEFLYFYLAAAVAASLAFMGLELVTGTRHQMLGASGAVFATMMLYAIHYPRDRIYIFFILPIEVRWLVFLYAVFDLHPVLKQLSGDGSQDGVAHAAHVGGLAFGFLYWKFQWHITSYVTGLDRLRFWIKRRIGAQRHLKVVRADDDDLPTNLDDRVDELLAKIHEHGESSLTEDERRILQIASERLRSRRGK